jgi:hypothetical protein
MNKHVKNGTVSALWSGPFDLCIAELMRRQIVVDILLFHNGIYGMQCHECRLQNTSNLTHLDNALCRLAWTMYMYTRFRGYKG